MEGNDGQPPPCVQPGNGPLQHPGDGRQLIVHGDADALKAPLGRVLLFPQGRGGHRPPNDLHELPRGLDGGFFPGPLDGGGDGPGVFLLAVLG